MPYEEYVKYTDKDGEVYNETKLRKVAPPFEDVLGYFFQAHLSPAGKDEGIKFVIVAKCSHPSGNANELARSYIDPHIKLPDQCRLLFSYDFMSKQWFDHAVFKMECTLLHDGSWSVVNCGKVDCMPAGLVPAPKITDAADKAGIPVSYVLVDPTPVRANVFIAYAYTEYYCGTPVQRGKICEPK